MGREKEDNVMSLNSLHRFHIVISVDMQVSFKFINKQTIKLSQ